MLSRPLGLDESNERGRGLVSSPHAVVPLAEEEDHKEARKGVFSSAAPWSSSSSSLPSPSPRSSSNPSFLSSLAPLPSLFTPLPACSSLSSPLHPSLFAPLSLPCAPPSVSRLTASLSSSSTLPHPVPLSLHPHLMPPVISVPSPSSPPSLSLLFASPLPPPPPPPPVFSPPCLPPSTSPGSSSPSAAPHLLPPPPLSPPTSSAPPPCCPCASLLPRLLASHRAEMRHLLKGALASLGRRLDSLERSSRGKRRKKKSQGGGGGGGVQSSASVASSSSSSYSICFSSSSSSDRAPLALDSFSSGHAPLALDSSSSDRAPLALDSFSSDHAPLALDSSSSLSSDSEDSAVPTASSNSNQSEQRRRQRRTGREESGRSLKRQRKEDGEGGDKKEKEEEGCRRFVGRMVVSFKRRRGAEEEEEAPLTLHNYCTRPGGRGEEEEASQAEKTFSFTMTHRNGYPQGPRIQKDSSSSSQHALDLVQSAPTGWASSQSGSLDLATGQWYFSDSSPFFSPSSNHSAFRLCLHASSSLFSPAPILRLSAVAVETFARGGACVHPLRPLRDWTAPPSLGIDHCYMRTPRSTFSDRRQRKQRANHSSRTAHLPHRKPLPPPTCPANGAAPPLLDADQPEAPSAYGTNKEKGKRVSQIRIRRATPRETPLTPMGLPKVKRLKKKEFSLEEIYTNKNYKSPTANRSLETIFEEPREKDGALLLIGQQRRRRLLLFPDFTQPRKRKKPQAAGLPVVMAPRKRLAARRHCRGADDEVDLDVMLVERLSALEDFLLRQGLDV
ncbi:uncharacterized protein LOC142988221 [Genypterus blacodes]|uniref:uncharacterized protein LOC142988221 n=1 Tax=Genypterus blacodes TaxID=154954 RepID=UPI003F76534F